MPDEVHVIDVQPGHLAPSQPAQAEHEHHRATFAGFVGEAEQLFDGEVRVVLAFLAWGLDPGAWVGCDETVGACVGADAPQYAEVAQHHGRAFALRLAGDPFLHLVAVDRREPPGTPFGFHVHAPCAFQGFHVARLRGHAFLRDPCRP